jgi:hypothetical protein
MTNKEKIIDLVSGEETLVPMTTQEKAAYESEKVAAQSKQEELLAEVQAKAQAKATAQAKLAALGLTVEDLTALGL